MAQKQIRYGVKFDVHRENLKQIENDFKQLQTSLKSIQDIKIPDLAKLNNTSLKSASTILANIRSQAKTVQKALGQAFNPKLNTTNLTEFMRILKAEGTSMQQIYNTFSKAGPQGTAAFSSLVNSVSNTNYQLKQTQTVLDKISTTFANSLKWNLASSAINSITRSIQQAWGYTKSLDGALNDIRIVTGKSADDMAVFAAKANEAAQKLGVSTTDYTKGALIYAQQGLSDKEINARNEITAKVANVTGQSTEQAAEELTAVWNGYKVNADEAELYVDRLAAVASKTASNLEELSVGMSKVASAAASLGVGEDQLAAQLSTIIAATRQAPESVGTALRTVYARISDIKAGIDEDGTSLGMYSGKMAELGFNVLDAQGKLRNMGEVIEEIGGRWADLTKEQQINLAQVMAGQRQYSNLMALFEHFDEYNRALNIAQNATGTLQQQQDTYMEDVNAHLAVLKASVENIYDSLFSTEGMKNLIDGLSEAANKLASFIDLIGGGGNLLRSLGSIALMVFSTQIAKGINGVLMNAQAAKSRVMEFENTLEQVKEWQGIPQLDQLSQKLLENKQHLMEMAKLMTPQQFVSFQKQISDINIMNDELKETKSELNEINRQIKMVSPRQNLEGIVDSVRTQKTFEKNTNKLSEKFGTIDESAINSINELEKLKEEFQQSFTTAMSPGSSAQNTLKSMQTDLESYLQVFDTFTQKNKLLADHRNQFKELQQVIQELQNNFQNVSTKEQAQNILNQYGDVFQRIWNLATEGETRVSNVVNTVNDQIQSGTSNVVNRVREGVENINREGQKLNSFSEDVNKVFNIKSLTNFSGGLATVGMSIKQFQSLGSIWSKKEKDTSIGEKLLKTIISLGMGLSMLLPALARIKTAFVDLGIAETFQATAAKIATVANGLLTGSLKLSEVAANLAAAAHAKLNAIMATNPFVAIAAAVTIAVGAILAYNKAIEENRKATLENSRTIIDEENAIQDELQSHNELYNSLDELNKKYHQGIISRAELRNEIDNLAEQYDLEADKVKNLKQHYNDLKQAIIEYRIEEAQEKQSSIENEKEAAQDALLATGQGLGKGDTKSFSEYYNGKYRGFNFYDQNMSEKQKEIFNQTGLKFKPYINVKEDPQNLAAIYDQILATLKLYNSTLSSEELENNPIVERLKAAEKYLRQDAEEYKKSQEEFAQVEADINAWQGEKAAKTNFYEIQKATDYIKERDKLIEQFKTELNKTPEEAEKMADAFLRNNFKQLYSQFDEIANYTDKLKERFGSLNEEAVKALSNLTPDQLAFIEDLDISNWEQLQNILKYMETTDWSKLNIIANPQAAIQSAKSNFNRYKDLSDQYYEGKQISIKKDEDFAKLAPQVQAFFETMEDGTHVMTGNAKEFNEVVKSLELTDFKQNAAAFEASQERLKKLQNVDINDYAHVATDVNKDFKTDPNHNVHFAQDSNIAQYLQQQLDILTEFGHDVAQIAGWQALLSDGQASISTIREIAKAVSDYTNQTEKLTQRQKENKDAMLMNEIAIGKTASSMKELRQYLDEGLIGQKAFTKAAIELDEALDLEGLDRKELEEFGDHLQQVAKSSDELANSLQADEEAADIVAKSIMKMNRGVEALAKNWEDWSDLIANSSDSSKEYSDAMDSTRDAMADLLDISKDFISEEFVKNHLAEIGQAANGSETAIDGLKSALAEDIIARIIVENGIGEAEQAEILANLASLQAAIPDIEVGTTLDTGAFLEQAQALIDACGLTVDQANALFDSLGFQANFATEPQMVQQRTPNMITETQVTGFTQGFARMATPGGISLPVPWSYPILSQNTYQNGYSVHSGVIDVPAMSTNGKTPKINSLTKKAGGSFNNGSSRNAGGNNSGKGGKGGGGKGGGGKGGGGGKAPQPDTSQKDRKKDVEDTRDIYHDINIELEQINRRLDRAQKKQDRLYGKQLLDNLNEQTRILEEHKAALEQKHRIQEQDLKTQQETLKNLGVTFDEYNNISNYMDILGRKQAQINAETQKYNSLIDAYNASTDKDLKKALSEEADKINKQIKQYDDEYKDLEKKIKDYDSLRVAMEDVVDQIEEETQKQIEINIKKFRMEIEIRLEMGQAERDWNKFRREVLEHTDVIKDTDFQEIFSNARQNFSDVFSYFDVHGTKGSLQMLTEQLMNTRAEIEAINEIGKSAIYGDNKAQAMEDLQKDLKELMSQMEDVQSLIDDIGEAYLDTIDDVADQFDKQIEDYEYVEDLLEHDIDLLQLIYGDKNYDAMQKYYDTLTRNNLNHLDALKKQRDFWKQEWEQAVARGDVQAAKQFEQNYKETLENLNSLIEDAAQNIQDKYINAIDKIFDELDKKISNGKGTDYLSTQWDLMNKNAEEYLDTINSAFAIQETERKYQKAIDESKNIKNQQTLKKLMDDQLNILRNKEKVSQYDVDRAEKLLQVEQARIALQEAQSAKTTLRLKRDSQGNYSYQYVANDNAVDDARDNLAQAQNDLYNFDKERYQSVLNDMLAAWKDFQSEYKEILEDTSLAEEERIERLALLRDEYGEYINDKTAQNVEARQNLMESAFADMAALYNTDVANYNQMSIDEQNILMGDLVPAWQSGIQQMSDKVAGEGGFIPVCEQAFDSITEATKDYEEQLENMANAAGVSLDYVTQGVDLLSEEFMRLIDNNDDLIDRMYSEVDAIQTLQDAARELVNEYQNIYNEAKTAVSEIHNFIQEEQGRAAAYMETANVAIESYHRTAQAYADAYDQMASAFENYAARVRAAASGDSSSGGSNGGNGGTGGGTGATSSPSGNKSSKSSGNNKEIIETEEGFIAGGEYYKKYYYDSGGYTGNWHSTEGRPAILHQKELVLNENDTKNFLEGTRVLREISSSLQGSLYNRIDNIGLNSLMPTNKEELEQNVHIEASFPNVNSKKEIEEAFNDLVNLAAQRAMRNN